MSARRWSAADEIILKTRYPIEGNSPALREALGRSRIAIASRVCSLRLFVPALRSRPWTSHQDAILSARYVEEGPSATLQKELNRTRYALYDRAEFLGLVRVERTSWTEDEDALIRQSYAQNGAALNLKGRNAQNIHQRAKRLGVKRVGYTWTDEEIAILRERYSIDGTGEALIAVLGRTAPQIASKAKRLGLVPSLSTAERSARLKKVVGTGEKNKGYTGYRCISGSYIGRVRKAAIRRGLDCPLLDGSREHYEYLYSLITPKCPLSGLPVTFPIKHKDSTATASLDRIDSDQGYIRGNVRWVHKDVNRVKWSLTDQEFFELANRVAKLHPIDI